MSQHLATASLLLFRFDVTTQRIHLHSSVRVVVVFAAVVAQACPCVFSSRRVLPRHRQADVSTSRQSIQRRPRVAPAPEHLRRNCRASRHAGGHVEGKTSRFVLLRWMVSHVYVVRAIPVAIPRGGRVVEKGRRDHLRAVGSRGGRRRDARPGHGDALGARRSRGGRSQAAARDLGRRGVRQAGHRAAVGGAGARGPRREEGGGNGLPPRGGGRRAGARGLAAGRRARRVVIHL